jgi:DNA repair photolyase
MKARGTASNPPNRFERLAIELDESDRDGRPWKTEFFRDHSQSIISTNDSPDISFTAGVNPYRGCEHGCAYCYARPYHEYLGFSAGLDFESRIMVKTDAAALLARELSSRSWQPRPVAMSGVTDCYQPVERRLGITRACLEVLAEFRNPVGVVTKNHLVTRDIDPLQCLAAHQACVVNISITTLDPELARRLEPRASLPEHRLDAIRRLAAAGIPAGVLTAPIIPGLNEHEIPSILAAAAEAGATRAGYTVLRLPHSVKEVFAGWLATHFPDRAEMVLNRVRDLHRGSLIVSTFGERMRGTGIFAEQIARLFEVSVSRLGLNRSPVDLSAAAFRRPPGPQLELF